MKNIKTKIAEFHDESDEPKNKYYRPNAKISKPVKSTAHVKK